MLKEDEVKLRGPHHMLGGMRQIMEAQRREELEVRQSDPLAPKQTPPVGSFIARLGRPQSHKNACSLIDVQSPSSFDDPPPACSDPRLSDRRPSRCSPAPVRIIIIIIIDGSMRDPSIPIGRLMGIGRSAEVDPRFLEGSTPVPHTKSDRNGLLLPPDSSAALGPLAGAGSSFAAR